MTIKNKLLLLSVAFFLTSCGANRSTGNRNNAETGMGEDLLFQSGFEGSTKVIPFRNDANKITGNESAVLSKSNWDEDLNQILTKSEVYLNYTGGDESKRFAKIITEPSNPANHVLHFWLNDSWLASENQQKARVQLDLYAIKEPLREFYQTVRVFLHEDFNVLQSYPSKIGWLTIAEFWNNEWWDANEQNGFRITLGIGKPDANKSELNFILNAEDKGQKEVWKGGNTNVKVPIGKWFTMDYYVKEGNKETGRFYMAITPEGGEKQVVFDVHNFTHCTKDPAPNGFTGYNPMKLYTSKEIIAFVKGKGKTLQIYWDDFKLWTNKRP